MRYSSLIIYAFATVSMFFSGGSALCEQAVTGNYPEKVLLKSDDGQGGLSLCSPLAVYRNAEGRDVFLVGAVHLGEKSYYDELNRRFAGYDAVLFEMVGGEDLQRILELKKKERKGELDDNEKEEMKELIEKAKKEKNMGGLEAIVGQYGKMASLMGVCLQKDEIDYSHRHFIHADMTEDELNAAQKAKGESMVGLMIAGAFKSLTSPQTASFDLWSFSESIQKQDKRALKYQLIQILESQVEQQFMVNTVLVEGRNDKCLEVFDRVVTERPELKKVGIFYGAAHLPDFHRKLEQKGYKFISVEWIPAWVISPEGTPSSNPEKSSGKQ